ncbi:hypothetical protein TWF481_005825 [Arthrobotrys musiformis]|uniref:Uncharacterized protein n=1 Tax=Arthrobotrys musiformis TaxID=47236 RepID=A0AAV9WEX4_9PEZI
MMTKTKTRRLKAADDDGDDEKRKEEKEQKSAGSYLVLPGSSLAVGSWQLAEEAEVRKGKAKAKAE